MNIQSVPTKGSLIANKKSLELAKVGFELLDRKRNILVREMMALIDHASLIQDKIDETYSTAYKFLQRANITLGMCREFSDMIVSDDSLVLSYRSVMGVEIPIVSIGKQSKNEIPFAFHSSNSALDEAYLKFIEVKNLTTELSEVENSIYRLADAIKKTKKRANALKNIVVPRLESTVKYITEVLEEKDREEFSRLKVIKRKKQGKS